MRYELSMILLLSNSAVMPSPGSPSSASGDGPKKPWTIIAVKDNKETYARIEKNLALGVERIEKFFGERFEKPFEVEVHSSRAKFDEYFKKRWQLPKTEPWMVASGVADKLTILTPRVWKTEAAEHDPEDETHFRELIAHELVHVFHGQHNRTRDFDGMDDLA